MDQFKNKYVYRIFLLVCLIAVMISPTQFTADVFAQEETPSDLQKGDSGAKLPSYPPRVIGTLPGGVIKMAPFPEEAASRITRTYGGPNLIYYSPYFWDTYDPIILSMDPTATYSDAQLNAGQNFYLNMSVGNSGDTNIPAGSPFTLCVVFDGSRTTSYCETITAGLPAGYFLYYEVNQLVDTISMSAGDHTAELVADIDNQIVETNEYDNSWINTYTWIGTSTPSPDFTFYTPSGWGYPVNLSSVSDFSDSLLYSNSYTYVRVGIKNQGDDNFSPFTVSVKIDGLIKTSTVVNLTRSSTTVTMPVITSSPSGGWHTVQVILDSGYQVTEINESNNLWTADFYWESTNLPNLRPYQLWYWDDAITISSESGKHVIDTLTLGEPVYVNWAVGNDGFGSIPYGESFTVALKLDGVDLDSWTWSGGLDYGWYVCLISDEVYTINTSGWHSLGLFIDLPGNNITEVNENDNTYERWFYVEPSDGSPVMRVEPTQINVQLTPNDASQKKTSTAVSQRDMNNLPDFDPLKYTPGALYTPPGRYILPISPPIPDMRNYALPTSVDNTGKLPPVGDQGNAGSCVSWATGYYSKTWQEAVDRSWSLTSTDHQFSPNYIWNQIQLTQGQCSGTYVSDAYQLLQEQGDVPLSMLPYAETCSTSVITQTMRDTAANYKAKSYGAFFQYGTSATDSIITQMKQWLVNGQPIVIAIPVYGEFDSPAGNYCIVDTAQHSGQNRGGHAITIVDYNDNIGSTGKGGFRIVNSWSASYGCNGFAYLTYDWVKQYVEEAWWMEDVPNGENNDTTRDFTIYNDGTGTLEVTSIGKRSSSPWLTLTLPDSLPILIEPGQSKTVTLNFDKTGLSNTTYSETIDVVGTGVTAAAVVVNLSLDGSSTTTVPAAGTPNPADTAAQQPVNGLVLNWQPGNVPSNTTYDVRLGTSNPPENTICNDSSSVSCPVSGLRTSTTYYWRVVSQSGSQQVLSPVWTFTTGPSGSNPQPVVGGTNPTRVGYAIKKNFVITIYGSGFLSYSIAQWQGTSLTTTIINGNTLQAVVPYSLIIRKLPRKAKSVTNYVTVYTPTPGGGTSNQYPVIINANPRPVLTSLSQTSIQKGSAGFTLVVTGKNFSVNSVIKWKGKVLATNYINSTSLGAYVPASYLKKKGTAKVTVYTSKPSGGTSKGRTFKILK